MFKFISRPTKHPTHLRQSLWGSGDLYRCHKKIIITTTTNTLEKKKIEKY